MLMACGWKVDRFITAAHRMSFIEKAYCKFLVTVTGISGESTTDLIFVLFISWATIFQVLLLLLTTGIFPAMFQGWNEFTSFRWVPPPYSCCTSFMEITDAALVPCWYRRTDGWTDGWVFEILIDSMLMRWKSFNYFEMLCLWWELTLLRPFHW